MSLTLVPDTYHLPISALAELASNRSSDGHRVASTIVNALFNKQRQTEVLYVHRAKLPYSASFGPVFKNTVPGFTPRQMRYAAIANSDIVLDALATWAIGTANLEPGTYFSNPAKIKSIGTRGAHLLLDASLAVLTGTDFEPALTVPNICEAFWLYEDARQKTPPPKNQ